MKSFISKLTNKYGTFVEIDKESVDSLFNALHKDISAIYRSSIGLWNRQKNIHAIVSSTYAALYNLLSDLESLTQESISVFKSIAEQDGYRIDFSTQTKSFTPKDSFVASSLDVDPKTHKSFLSEQTAIVDTDTKMLTPSIKDQQTFMPVKKVVFSSEKQLDTAYNSGDIEKYYDFFMVSNSPKDKEATVEINYDTEITINSLILSAYSEKEYDIKAIYYYDTSTGSWQLLDNVGRMNTNDKNKIVFQSITTNKLRVVLNLHFIESTIRTYYNLNEGILQKLVENHAFLQDMAVYTNANIHAGIMTYIYHIMISDIYTEHTEYNDVSVFVGRPYETSTATSLSLSEDSIKTTNGAIEYYVFIEDVDKDTNTIGSAIIPILPNGINDINDEILYPSLSTMTAKTMFPVNTDNPYTVTKDGTALDSGTDYTIDYNTVTFNSVDSESRYAISYKPMFVNSAKLYTINKRPLESRTEALSTIDGTIDSANNTITFKLEVPPDSSTLSVDRIFDDTSTPIPQSDISIDGVTLVISNFDPTAPSYMNAIYEISYTPLQSLINDGSFYYFGPNNSVIIANDTKEKVYGVPVTMNRMYLLVVIRDVSSQTNSFVAINNATINIGKQEI